MKSSVRTLSIKSSFGSKIPREDAERTTTESRSDIPAVPAVPKAFLIGRPQKLAPKIAAANEKLDEKRLRTEVWEEEQPETGEDIEEQQNQVYSSRAKWAILSIITLAGMLPNLTAFMYLPALNNISEVSSITILSS